MQIIYHGILYKILEGYNITAYCQTFFLVFSHFSYHHPFLGFSPLDHLSKTHGYHSLHTYLENILDPFTPQFCSNLLGTFRPWHLTCCLIYPSTYGIYSCETGETRTANGVRLMGQLHSIGSDHTKPHFEDSEAPTKLSEDFLVVSAVLRRGRVMGRGCLCYACIVLSKTVADPAGSGPALALLHPSQTQ